MAVIWSGIFVCVGVALHQLPAAFTLRDGLAVAQLTSHLEIMDTSTDLSKPYTLWSGVVGGMFLAMAYFGADQSQVQRYLSSKSLKESRLSLLFTAFLKVPMQFLILLTGVLVFLFFHFERPPLLWNSVALRTFEERGPAEEVARLKERFETAYARRRAAAEAWARSRNPDARSAYLDANAAMDETHAEAGRLVQSLVGGKAYNDTNYVFPTYIVTQLPRGIAGLVIAVIFAAAMTALSGESNSLATASMVDVYQRFVRPAASESHYLAVSRLLTAGWGLFACAVALQTGRLGSAIEVVNRFGSYFYGSILGVFALAILTPRASARGAFYGLLAGMVAVAAVSLFTNVAFLWYNVVGAVSVFAAGLLITAALPTRREAA
jgi:Na+/proline symporter